MNTCYYSRMANRIYTHCTHCKKPLAKPVTYSRQCAACHRAYLDRRVAEGRIITECYKCGGPVERAGPQKRLCNACERAKIAAMTPEARAVMYKRNAALVRARKERDPEYRRRYNVEANAKRYGLSVDEYERIISSGCEICGSEVFGSARAKRLAIDHDHETGKVRGALCGRCNMAIGQFGHDPDVVQRAVAYLRRHALKSPV